MAKRKKTNRVPEAATKPSDPAAVDAYLQRLKHPQAALVALLRRAVLAVDPAIGEEIKWNAPAFFYTGPMAGAGKYDRFLVVLNLYRRDCVRLVFWHGDRAGDRTGFLTGDYPDGRRLAVIMDAADLQARTVVLRKTLKAQLRHLR